MGQLKVILPAMGEGIFEATITQWLINEGDSIAEDDSLVEIATDKVDSEIPSPASGILKKILIASGEVAKIGQEIAIIDSDEDPSLDKSAPEKTIETHDHKKEKIEEAIENIDLNINANSQQPNVPFKLSNGKFLSPLVRSISDKENLSLNELESIQGSGLDNRITKEDILRHLENKTNIPQVDLGASKPSIDTTNVEIIEMDRMRKLIADHMVHSKKIAPHVTSFHEVDVTNMVNWRNKYKDEFLKRYGQKLTFTPIFVDAVVKAIKKFPMINISVDGNNILMKKNVNIGMATALPDGNLIVPVIHKADELSLPGLAGRVNDLANRARNKQLKPNEIQGGTFTITNVGTFGNLSGTPIINQPQVAILAIGAIKKRAAVIETPDGDLIGIRHQMVLALSYDHRVVDGSLGGMFLRQIADNMEAFEGKVWL